MQPKDLLYSRILEIYQTLVIGYSTDKVDYETYSKAKKYIYTNLDKIVCEDDDLFFHVIKDFAWFGYDTHKRFKTMSDLCDFVIQKLQDRNSNIEEIFANSGINQTLADFIAKLQ